MNARTSAAGDRTQASETRRRSEPRKSDEGRQSCGKPSWSQAELEFRGRGGARAGAGRKPQGALAGVPHRSRAAHTVRFPVQITTRLKPGLPSLRRGGELAALRQAMAAGSQRTEFRVVHHTIQTNHLHLIVEAADRLRLSLGVRALLIRIARALNRLWARRGSVFGDRFHERALRTPTEVRRSLVYVLQNVRKHGVQVRGTDAYSSGPWFDGWEESPAERAAREVLQVRLESAGGRLPAPVAALTWLLRVGWTRLGRLGLHERPAG